MTALHEPLVVLSALQLLVLVISAGIIVFQLRQTNRISRANAYQDLTSTFAQFITLLATNPTVAAIYSRGRLSPNKLSKASKDQFFLLCGLMFSFHENIYILHKKGLLEDDYYLGWSRDLDKNLEQEGFIEYWRAQGDEYSSAFTKRVGDALDRKN